MKDCVFTRHCQIILRLVLARMEFALFQQDKQAKDNSIHLVHACPAD